MARKSLKDISKIMSKLDICMMNTVTTGGEVASRPMSNNGDAKYNGTSYFFTKKDERLTKDLKKNKKVGLSFISSGVFSKSTYLSVSGIAKMIDDRKEMLKHWNKDLEVWFEDGIDSPDILMIEVKADHIKYWQGMEQGELDLKRKRA